MLYLLAAPMLLASCDVHEFPELPEKEPFHLRLNYETDMTIWEHVYDGTTLKEVGFGATYDNTQEYGSMRSIVRIYPSTEAMRSTRSHLEELVVNRNIRDGYDQEVTVEMPGGEYNVMVWSDITQLSTQRPYYNADDFFEVMLQGDHIGNTDYRDAFRGEVTATVTDPVYYVNSAAAAIDNQATVPMIRPMGKYQFVSTDVDIFLTRVAEQMREQGLLAGIDPSADPLLAYEQLLKQIDLGEYQVVFRYNAFMPCSFNMFTNKPADSWTGITYRGALTMLQSGKMSLGFDYIFVNGTETTLAISVAVFNKDGVEISSTNAINVPIVRSKLTLVTGDFLTSKSSGGVNIQYEYNGEYNVEIQ